MNKSVAWQSIVVPLDVSDACRASNHLRCWLRYEGNDTGVAFQCETTRGLVVDLRVDVITERIIRLRMNPEGIQDRPSDMLVRGAQDGTPVPFSLRESGDLLVLTTGRLQAEFPRFPWSMRVFAGEPTPTSVPFFSQRFDDRAYGPGYEVPPTGFDDGPGHHPTVRETVVVSPGEAFYGLGERFTPLDKWGQEIVFWTADSGNVSSYRGYKNVPFLMSSAGYGLFVHSSFPTVFRMGSESTISYSIHIDDSQLDYYLIYGPEFRDILSDYTALTGRAPVPPKWSFGFWISRAGYQSREEVEEVIRGMRARDFPCDVISLDPWWMGEGPWSTLQWDTGAFPEPAEMIHGLRAQGVRTCLWINPYLPSGTELHTEALERGYLVLKPNGGPSPVIEAFAGHDLAAIDFTNPEACAWFQSRLQHLLDMGVAVFKADFGEQAPVEAVYHDGRTGLEMHNLYPLLYNKTVFDLTERAFGRGFTWGRAAYAGSQRYPVQWGGDSYSSLDQMAGQIRGLLSYGMSGVPFASHDVGGFDYPPAAFDLSEPAEKWFLQDCAVDSQVYVRWLQFGVFSSHVRAHGKQPKEPWLYGSQEGEIARRYLKLRYRLLPYIYSQAVKSAQTGLPVVRPMVLEFQTDPTTHRLDLQYMFGDSFLVAPVVRRDNRCRVYLPAGEWVDYWTKETMCGPCWLDLEVPLETLPLWARGGAVIPMGPEMAYVGEKPLDPLTLELYRPRALGTTTVHDEDRPEIRACYERRGDQLAIDVGPAPGQVEMVLYGIPATAARRNARPVEVLLPRAGASGAGSEACVHFDGTTLSHVVFQLADSDSI